MPYEIERTDDEWRGLLAPDRYRVLRASGTEPPFTNAYWDEHDPGVYRCGGCEARLFHSADKFDSGTGWPSFVRPASDSAVETQHDTSHGMSRIEVRCARCGSHLGHLFEDGPAPRGHRYCMNSAALTFDPSR